MQYLGINIYPSKDYTVCRRSILFQNEFWKDVIGYEVSYMVSSLGRVKSLDRIINSRLVKGKHLKKQKDKYGYNYVALGGNKKFKVHQLVAKSFIENINNYPTVNHDNEVKTDNRVCNLQWFTFAQQNTYSKGFPVSFYYENKILSYPSLNQASEDLKVDRSVVERLANEYIEISNIVKNLLENRHWIAPKYKSFKTNTTTGYTGILIKNGNYEVRLTLDGRRTWIGAYKTLEEAVEERDNFIVTNGLNYELNEPEKLADKNLLMKSFLTIKQLINFNTLPKTTQELINIHEQSIKNLK